MLPWRFKNFISENFPLLYHKISNIGVKVNTAAYWDEIYDKEWDSPKRIWPTKNKLIESETRPTDAILDIACGTGSILRHLKKKGYQNLYGTEISPLCKRRLTELGITAFESHLPKIDYQDDSFDVVIASQILEHIIKRDRFLDEIKRVARPDATCFLFVPDDCLGPIDEPSHVIKFTRKRLTQLLSKHFTDFSVTSIKDENFPMPILYAHIRIPQD
ncbi:class I SAM-dependent methyltransferase [Paremcibacter congregatus]|uniref:class I SAM-dependent methyltransferase n=1 Tax=Paremcibacter congregatus TaxID=2043170 RepID=UPI003A8F6A16|tara:strand:- start:482 stop:1132 length:651 start_codon:yes stop_codon:yes gene_type:complete